MEIENIVTIIAAVLAFVASALSLLYNVNQAKKDRIQKVVLNNRIEYLKGSRSGFSSLIALCTADAVKLAQKDPEIMKVYVDKWFCGYGQIKTYLKPFYAVEKDILNALELLHTFVLSALYEKRQDLSELAKMRDDFVGKYHVYDWAYWKYIQEQKNGKYINSDDDFDTIYDQLSEEVKNGAL